RSQKNGRDPARGAGRSGQDRAKKSPRAFAFSSHSPLVTSHSPLLLNAVMPASLCFPRNSPHPTLYFECPLSSPATTKTSSSASTRALTHPRTSPLLLALAWITVLL